MKLKLFFLVLTFVITFGATKAQITVSPNKFSVNDSITIYFNPTLGNKGLSKVKDIYIYSGLITLKSQNKTDWQYAPMQWCDTRDEYKLTRISDTCYYFGINIKKFYHPNNDDSVFNIGFYFSNSDCSLLGMTEENEYFHIDLVQPGLDFKSYYIKDNQLVIKTELFEYTLDMFDNNRLKIDFHRNAMLSASQKLSVLKKLPNIKVTVTESDSNLLINNSDFITIINKQPVSFTIVRHTDTIIKDLKINSNFGWHYEFDPLSRIYGAGSIDSSIDKNNRYIFLYNCANFGYPSKPVYTSYSYPKISPYSSWNIPFYVSSDLYSIYFDSPGNSSIDLGKYTSGVAEYYSYSIPLSLYIQIGNTLDELVTDFNLLTGRPPLPAYWSLGYLQSNFAYWNADDIIRRLPLYKKNRIPCEAFMIDYSWCGGGEKIGEFDWDYENNFKHPAEFLDSMKAYNIKCLLISHSYLTLESKNFQNFYDKNLLATTYEGKPYILDQFRAYAFTLIDLFNPAAKDEFWELFKAKYDEGIAGWWNDLNEPEMHPENLYHFGGYSAYEIHNLYPYLWSELLYNKFASYRPNERLVHFSRGGSTGMQKFGTICWSGDVKSSYDGLNRQIPIMLGLGIAGVYMVGSDVGGFDAIRKNSELYTRWIQFSSFTPLLRPHSNGVQPPEPFYHDEPYLSICRRYIELRYKLLPYIYTLCYEATSTGHPLVRQMDYYDIQNKDLQNINTQYYFGNDFLVAPIMDSITKRGVLLPKGTWYEFKNNKRYIGGKTINVDYDINDMPIFVRGGAIIPTTYSVFATNLFKYDYYKFMCYPDSAISESEGKMYIDDGRNPKALEQKNYELINVKMNNQSDKLTFELQKEGNGFQEFSDAVFEMQVFNIKKFISVYLNTQLLTIFDSYDKFVNSGLGVFYNNEDKTLYIKYPWNHQSENLIECIKSNDVTDEDKINIYPNPTNGKLTINLSKLDTNSASINLYSVNGDKITSLNSSAQKSIELDLTKLKLSYGVYFVEIKTPEKTFKYKIIFDR